MSPCERASIVHDGVLVPTTGAIQSINILPVIVAAPEMVEALRGLMRAADELMTEFVSKKRAANWGVINDSLFKAGAILRRIDAR